MNDIVRIDLACGRAELDTRSAVLRLFADSDRPALAFKLTGSLEYADHDSRDQPVRLAENRDGRHLVFRGTDGVCDKEVHVEIRDDGWIDYWLTAAPRAGRPAVRSMHYGQDGAGHENGSDHAIEEFFVLCPDRYGSAVPRTAKVNVKLGIHAHRFDKDSEFAHDGGRAIIPPYVVSLGAGAGWLGAGTLEIPSSEWGLNLTLLDGKARLDFDYGINLTLAGPYTFPRITFFGGTDKLGVVRAFVNRLYDDGLAVRNEQWEDCWSGPLYCFFSDQMYQYQVDRPTEKMLGEIEMKNRYCTDEFLVECVEFLHRHDIACSAIIYDAGWFVMNGSWRPDAPRVKDLRGRIRRLQEQGHKVLLWYAPYFACADSDHYKAHPEIAVRSADGAPVSLTRLGGEVNHLLDFTHPMTRELCRQDLRGMLSPEGLNADGLKIDCVHGGPDTSHRFHDPAWGLGERMTYNMMKFVYDEAKKIKPDCCVNSTAGNPLFNRTFDLHRIHDALEYNLHMYEQRAWAAWVCQAGLSDLDDWSSYDLFTVRANLRKIVYGVPSLYAVRRRGCQRRMGCGFGHSFTVSDEQLELVSSLFDLCRRVPIDLTQEVFIDPEDQVFWRKHRRGPLAGFFAATTLAGNQAVAVYEPRAAHVVSLADAPLAVPLPPGAGSVKLVRIGRTGDETPVERFDVVAGNAVFDARRCCGDVKRYEIRYALS